MTISPANSSSSISLQEISARIRQDISTITGIPREAIGEDASFQKDLGLDSLSLLELVVNLEYAFKIKVPEDQFPALQTVKDTAQFVFERLSLGA
jgi:acyl carrier protein